MAQHERELAKQSFMAWRTAMREAKAAADAELVAQDEWELAQEREDQRELAEDMEDLNCELSMGVSWWTVGNIREGDMDTMYAMYSRMGVSTKEFAEFANKHKSVAGVQNAVMRGIRLYRPA